MRSVTTVAWGVFAATVFFFLYVYRGYLWILRLLVRWKARGGAADPGADSRGAAGPPREGWPGLTVYLPVLNEEDRIEARLQNILAQEYPQDSIEVLVVSDGSTDRTVDVVRCVIEANPLRDIRLIAFEENRGRAAVQNLVAREARHDVLVSTDADSIFETSFLARVASRFADPGVGVVSGTLVYRDPGTAISDAIRRYWSYETALRMAEQELGVLAHASGPCLAYRRSIWQTIDGFEDVDRVAIFFARRQGLEVVQAPDAICYDTPNHHWRQEIRVRRRMTRKGVLTVLKRWGVRDMIRDPLFTVALYSHKVARFATPLFALALAVSVSVLAASYVGPGAGALAAVALALALVGSSLVGVEPARRLTGKLKSFAVANVGFALGLLDVLRGDREGRYEPTRNLAPDEPRAHSDGSRGADPSGGGGAGPIGVRRVTERPPE